MSKYRVDVGIERTEDYEETASKLALAVTTAGVDLQELDERNFGQGKNTVLFITKEGRNVVATFISPQPMEEVHRKLHGALKETAFNLQAC